MIKLSPHSIRQIHRLEKSESLMDELAIIDTLTDLELAFASMLAKPYTRISSWLWAERKQRKIFMGIKCK